MRTHRYVITIRGGLGGTFGDFRIEPNGTNTALIGDLDQAALYGMLSRIQSLGLELVELSRLADGTSHPRPSASPGGGEHATAPSAGCHAR